jgi:hypothetical protein
MERKFPRNSGLKRPVRMKAIFKSLVPVVLVALTSGESLAMRSIGIITVGEAKAMGLEVRATADGPDAVWLEMDFTALGKLKDYQPEFSRVEVEVREGQKPLPGYLALREQHPRLGRVRVRFMADRADLNKLVLTIVVGHGAVAGGAYELRVKEFVDLSKIR